MQVNKLLKGLMIAVPAMTLMACSSSSSVDEQAQQTNASSSASSSNTGANSGSGVQVGSAEKVLSPAEKMKQELATLKSDQVVYFDFDRSSVRSEDYALLDMHSAFLVKNPSVSVVVEGHTDDRGTPDYNIALGERRAKAVQTYLENAGVGAAQISVVSYGEEKPADASHSQSAFTKNRRAVLVYQQ